MNRAFSSLNSSRSCVKVLDTYQSGLAKVASIILAVYLVLKLGDLLVTGEIGLVLDSGWYSVLFLAEMIIGVIAPLLIFASRARESERGLLIGTVYVIVGLALNRAANAWFALRGPTGYTYFPYWIEIAIVAAAFAAGILFFTLGVRFLPALREPVLEEGHTHP